MNLNGYDAVVRLHALQRRFLQQDEIGNFPRLDGSDLRIDSKLSCVIDGRSFEDLLERNPSALKLLHLQIAVQAREISIGRAGRVSVPKRKLASLPAR